ncbi:hypothetical protein [Paenibacillus donghaensis]|uniref:Uncharacterized protein n=1 Tax=Paenibacillus donghaensis TaxID=414771 RepID=A0A2Z2KQN4_9BACL|nr:hypothetical protein [Paenibacillus donghaensis]ASA22651.1 hypothetical protein B9T62_18765 [Paenibacillus donghaensis]
MIELGKWGIKNVRIIDKCNSVIELYIPGVNQQDRVDIKLTLIDAMRGISIEDKTKKELQKWRAKCQKENERLDWGIQATKKLIKSYGEE